MKKLISTFVFVIGFVAITMAQDATNTAATMGADELAKSKTTGVYVYNMPDNLTSESVDQASTYYVAYFNIDFDEDLHQAKVNMVSEEAQAKAVMIRFLSACGVHYVSVDDQTMNLTEFLNQHLQ